MKIEGLTGYREDSYSEQEVVSMATDYVWNINKIEKRGEILLDFLNERWGISFFKTDEVRKEILGINYLFQNDTK